MTGAQADDELDDYLVPFGQEKGGLLDFLKLPPNAKDAEVRAADNAYRKKLKEDNFARRQELKARVQKGELTKEEFEAQAKQLQDDESELLKELNALKSKYEFQLGERRKLQSQGRPDDSVAWQGMYALGETPEELWQFLAERRPLGRVDDPLLAAVEARWVAADAPELFVPDGPAGARWAPLADWPELTPAQRSAALTALRAEIEEHFKRECRAAKEQFARGETTKEAFDAAVEKFRAEAHARNDLANKWHGALEQSGAKRRAAAKGDAPPELPSRLAAAEGPAPLTVIAGLRAERDLVALLAADALWGEVGHTNRAYWADRVRAWAAELAQLGTGLGPDATGPPPADPEYPELCRVPRRSIDRLEAEAMTDESARPEGGRRRATVNLADLLAGLAGDKGGKEGQPLDLSLEQLAELFEQLGLPGGLPK